MFAGITHASGWLGILTAAYQTADSGLHLLGFSICISSTSEAWQLKRLPIIKKLLSPLLRGEQFFQRLFHSARFDGSMHIVKYAAHEWHIHHHRSCHSLHTSADYAPHILIFCYFSTLISTDDIHGTIQQNGACHLPEQYPEKIRLPRASVGCRHR